MKTYKNIIIGGGSSGLYLGMFLNNSLVLERGKVGTKILMSGGGNCNFTNKNITKDNYLSSNPDFVSYALSVYTQKNIMVFLEKNKIPYHEKSHGRMFLKQPSKALLGAFLKHQKAEIKEGYEVTTITKENDEYIINNEFKTKNLIIASGGMSYGGTDFGIKIAKQFKLKIINTYPALVRFDVDDKSITELAGLSVKDVKSRQFTDGIVFTKRGIGGPLIYQLSLYHNSGDTINLDFSNSEHVPKRLRKLLNNKKELVITPKKTAGFKFAEVMAGGIDTNEIDPKTFECKKHKGLYFIGEILDVTGNLGGYNLHFAFASAHTLKEHLST